MLIEYGISLFAFESENPPSEENHQQKNEMQWKRTDVAIRQIYGARRPLPQDQKFRD